jgi:hypothetical protein
MAGLTIVQLPAGTVPLVGTEPLPIVQNGITVQVSVAQLAGYVPANLYLYENLAVVSTDYTISTNYNAMSAGPITINSGVSITVPTGSSYSVV